MPANFDILKNKKMLAMLVAGAAIVLILLMFIRSQTKLVYGPSDGEKEPRYYNGEAVNEDNKLTVTGAFPCNNTTVGKYGVIPYLSLDNILLNGYERQSKSSFTIDEEEENQDVLTYRGNNLRNKYCFGDRSVSDGEFSSTWKMDLKDSVAITKNLDYIGQPVVVNWTQEELGYIKVSDNKKKKDSLTEVIVATLDGEINFYDIEDGTTTRKPINIGLPIVGTATICPDGYPLYVVGAGGSSDKDVSKVVIINLYTNEIVKEFGDRYNYAENPAEECYNFSSSALFSFNGNCLVYQGENGVTYSYTVNKSLSAGDLSVSFVQELKFTYSSNSGESGGKLAFTKAAAPAAFGDYIYQCDLNGNLVCFNENTQKMVWIRDLGDSILSTPVLEYDKETGHVYIYVGTSYVLGEGKAKKGNVFLYKINATSGEIIWEREEEVSTSSKMNGGVIGAPMLGEGQLSGYVYFTMAGVDGRKAGRLVCIDKKTGEQEYFVKFKNYIYSSPVAAYSTSGEGYLVVCDNAGNIFSLEGNSGKTIDVKKVGERITSSPIIYNNKLIVVSEKRVYGIEIK